jgi:hypothetical protein
MEYGAIVELNASQQHDMPVGEVPGGPLRHCQ